MQTKFKNYFQGRDQKEKSSHILLNVSSSILLLACLAAMSYTLQPQTNTKEKMSTSIAEVGGDKKMRATLLNNKFIDTNKTVYSANRNPRKSNQVTLSIETGSPK